MPTSKAEALDALYFGQRVAEEEAAELGRYFVSTEQWRQLSQGHVDIVYGYKGAGKSALYSTLLEARSTLFDRNILVVAGENPRGAPVFSKLVDEPPSSEQEFRNLWKLYFLQLIGERIREYAFSSTEARDLVRYLEQAELLPKAGGLAAFFRAAMDYVRHPPRIESLQGTLELDKVTALPSGLAGKVTFREPNAEALRQGFVSADHLFELAEEALAQEGFSLWILLDRLDVAFAGSAELEQNALRALFIVYADLRQHSHITPKIFLRTDIWERITASGFREASHIIRAITIQWDKRSLLNLVMKRIVTSEPVAEYYGVIPENILADVGEQERLFYRIFPQQVEPGGGRPVSFVWMLTRTHDATKQNAPRELIHLLSEARNVQLKKQEIGEQEPDGDTLITGNSFKDALNEVSKVRLNQTLFAEYPRLKPYVQKLRGGKTQHSRESLASLWEVDATAALVIIDELAEAGFFERRGSQAEPEFWVPFLYRDALDMIRGTAD